MQIVTVGVNHSTAPIDIRERLAVSSDALPRGLAELRDLVSEGFILSTCNRVEVYAICGHEATGGDLLRRWLATRGSLTADEVRTCTYAYAHGSAVHHAFRVAAGLDSLIIGENQILGQFRRGLEAARAGKVLGPMLARVGTSALACARSVRAITGIGRQAGSVVSVALRTSARVRGTLTGARVVVLGSGETAMLGLKHLARMGPERVTVVSRTYGRALDLSAIHHVDALPWERLSDALAEADLVVGCTSAPTPVLDVDTVRGARRPARAGPLICVDLGVPRDIEPLVGELPGVTLISLDQLRVEAAASRADRERTIGQAERIVGEEAERFMEWWRGRSVASAISRLRAHAQGICEAELQRVLARLPDLTPRERAVVESLGRRITAKLLHQPTSALKHGADGANMAVVLERLFALPPREAKPTPAP